MLHLAGNRTPAHQVHVGLKAVPYISEAKLRKTIFVKDYEKDTQSICSSTYSKTNSWGKSEQ